MKKIIIAITTIITFLLVTTCDEPTKPDTTPPTVEITYPISGSTVSGVTVVTATADDNEGVEHVEFYIDGQKKITNYQEPWQYEWDTEDYANGEQHSIYAKAYDEAENTSSSSVILVTIPELHYLLVSNDSLFYNDNQTQLSFNITNSGTGTLTWTISDDMTWLSVTPTTGNTTTESDQITATVDRTGLSPGNYTGTITVTPNNGNPVNIGVTMSVLEEPTLAISPQSLDFSTDQTSLTFGITNSGTGTLTWTISDDMTWLSVTPTTGNTTTESDQITATVDRTGLSPGNYTGTITVTPNNGNSGDVGITMTVIAYGYLAGYTYYSGTTIPVSGVSVNIDDEYYTTGTDGYFILNNIAIGNVLLTATKDGYDQY